MTKYAIIVFVVSLFCGCHRTSQPEISKEEFVEGEFLVSQEELPARVLQLAESLARLPRMCPQAEFENALVAAGLNRESDWFKDLQHFWYLDAGFHSARTREKRKYVITIAYMPKGNSTIATLHAAIHYASNGEHGRETIWQIDWRGDSATRSG